MKQDKQGVAVVIEELHLAFAFGFMWSIKVCHLE